MVRHLKRAARWVASVVLGLLHLLRLVGLSGLVGLSTVHASDTSTAPRVGPQRSMESAVSAPSSLAEALAQLRAPPVGSRLLRPFEVVINGTQAGHALVLEADGDLYADSESLRAWRIARDPATRLAHGGQTWFALRDVPGYRRQVDEETLTLELNFAASAFLATDLGNSAARAVLSPVKPVSTLTYDLSASHVRRIESTQSGLAGFLELAHGNRWGQWSSSWLASAQQLHSSAPVEPSTIEAGRVTWRRLETAYTRLFIDQAMSLRVGDTLARASATGASFYYAGLQLVSSADLLPGPSRQAASYLAGTADAPGSLQVFVNGVLRQSTRVPAGPFTLNQLPAVDGEGNVRLVVTDVLGRETVINQRLFNYAGLLPVGRQQWAVDAGWVRSAQSIGNAVAYGDPLMTGFWRRGLLERLTAEVRLTAAAGHHGQALGLTAALPWRTVASSTLSRSQTGMGLHGYDGSLELSHRSGFLSWALRYAQASRGFRQVANLGFQPPRQTLTTAVGYDTAGWGSGSFNLSEIEAFDGSRQALAGYNHSLRLGRLGFLSLSVNRVRSSSFGLASTSAFVNLSVPLGVRTTLSAQMAQGSSAQSQFLSIQQAPAQSPGVFWQGSVRQQAGQWQAQGSAVVETDRALWSLEASHSSTATALRAGARGAVVSMGGSVGALRTSFGGYALVEAEGLPSVGVLRDGQRVARTDSNGRALVGGLVPYMPNRIQLQADELPIEVEIDNLERTVVPADRSGAMASFTVRRGRPALVLIVLDDATPAPAGAELVVDGRDEVFYVARKGEAYLSGLGDRETVRLRWAGQQCAMDVILPPAQAASLARLGPLNCRGVKR